MTAWVLIYGIGYNFAYTVPSIATKDECERIYKEIAGNTWAPTSYRCIEYRIATR